MMPVPGKLEHRLRQNQSVSGNDDNVVWEAFELACECASRRVRLQDPKMARAAASLSRVMAQRKTAPRGSIS